MLTKDISIELDLNLLSTVYLFHDPLVNEDVHLKMKEIVVYSNAQQNPDSHMVQLSSSLLSFNIKVL